MAPIAAFFSGLIAVSVAVAPPAVFQLTSRAEADEDWSLQNTKAHAGSNAAPMTDIAENNLRGHATSSVMRDSQYSIAWDVLSMISPAIFDRAGGTYFAKRYHQKTLLVALALCCWVAVLASRIWWERFVTLTATVSGIRWGRRFATTTWWRRPVARDAPLTEMRASASVAMDAPITPCAPSHFADGFAAEFVGDGGDIVVLEASGAPGPSADGLTVDLAGYGGEISDLEASGACDHICGPTSLNDPVAELCAASASHATWDHTKFSGFRSCRGRQASGIASDQAAGASGALWPDLPKLAVAAVTSEDKESAGGVRTVDVKVEVECASTAVGEWVAVVGAGASLGDWNPARSVRLDGARFPVWQGCVRLELGSSVDYKYVIMRPHGDVCWEPLQGNRTRNVKADGENQCWRDGTFGTMTTVQDSVRNELSALSHEPAAPEIESKGKLCLVVHCADTSPGDCIAVTGSWNWDAPPQKLDGSGFPTWRGIVSIRPGQRIEYKYLLLDKRGKKHWENMQGNREVHANELGSTEQDDGDIRFCIKQKSRDKSPPPTHLQDTAYYRQILAGGQFRQDSVAVPQGPLVRRSWDLDDLRHDHGALRGGGSYTARLVDEVAAGEPHCQVTLDRRFSFAATLVPQAEQSGQDGLVVLFVWFRFMAMRQLITNKGCVKPSEVATAQAHLASMLTNILCTREELRDVTRLTMATIGRGASGDMGQRIRDEILEVLKLQGGKYGMLEQWHQKLHNNTCPDDVSICEALIDFIDSGQDKSVYWRRLEKDRIDEARLRSYDRKIIEEPSFPSQYTNAVRRGLVEYLKTLKAVHSGADLESAANAVIGYEQGSCKGKSITVEPISEVATAEMKELLARCIHDSERARGGSSPLPALEAMVELRWVLRPYSVAGGKRVGDRQKDVIYLDLALESAVRTTIEGSLSRSVSLPADELMAIAGVALENLTMSVGGNHELLLCLKDWKQVTSVAKNAQKSAWALRAKAAIDRVRNELGSQGERYMSALQPPAAVLGARLGIDPKVLTTFGEEAVRGGAAAPGSQLLRILDPMLRKMANLGAWQVISPVEVVGRLEVVDDLSGVQYNTYEKATVLIAERVGGDEEIPDGVVAVLTPDLVDVLSHVSVRARNEKRLFATVFDADVLDNLRTFHGKHVKCELSQNNDCVTVRAESESLDTLSPQRDSAERAASASGLLESAIKPRTFCGEYALVSSDFSLDVAGSKSCSLNTLRRRLPSWIGLPASVVLPFGTFDKVLDDPSNREGAREFAPRLQTLERAVSAGAPVAEILAEIRDAVMKLDPPAPLVESLRKAFQQEGLPWPGQLDDAARGTAAWKAIKGVWASKWNDRAFISCRKACLRHADLSMAVLCQEVIDARYAFVVHTTNPSTGDAGELYAELVCGLGEVLVGNYAGRALSFTARKGNPLEIKIAGYPSKSVGLFIEKPTMIFRSDSNGEDLEGYAGAGLYDSIIMDSSLERPVDYSAEPLLTDDSLQAQILRSVAEAAVAVENAMNAPQDIEGVIDAAGKLFIVQTRPQV